MEFVLSLFDCCLKKKKKSSSGITKGGDEKTPFVAEEAIVGSMGYHLTNNKNEELATFGAGCYWGTEKYYATNF